MPGAGGDRSLPIRFLTSPAEMEALEALQRVIWPGSETDIVPAHISLAISHNGGVVLGAFDGDRLVGFVMGFLGTDSETPERVAMARLKHCSHQLGVHPDYRGRGLGFHLKAAQRRIVAAQGVRLITWTYDPLLSLNAQLNIRRLGAICHRYIENAYGDMRDGLNAGIPSDRFQVDWWITSNRVAERIEGRRKPLDLAHFLSAGAVKVNDVSLDDEGFPHPAGQIEMPTNALALVEIPADFQAIKTHDHRLALAWRLHTRAIFEELFQRKFIITDFVHLRGERYPRSYYLLTHGEQTLG